jgi:transcriptional regulator GlxA family with amidase domain
MRTFLSVVLVLIASASAPASAATSASEVPVRVAFVISDNFNVIDFAGSWEVFQDTVLPGASSGRENRQPFELYTVAAKPGPVSSTGGARVIPEYTFETAPRPDIVVIGAQSDRSPELIAWLRGRYAENAILASVCTGASQLASTGLLDGKQATTHHDFVARFRERFPKVEWLEARRFVRSGQRLYTAGGLTSGVDLALHLVAERFGDSVAQATAEYMEYHGGEWKGSQIDGSIGKSAATMR